MTRNATKTATKIAHDLYVERKKAVTTRMNTIRATLATHAKAEKKDPRDWGFAADLGRVTEQLDEILASFTA